MQRWLVAGWLVVAAAVAMPSVSSSVQEGVAPSAPTYRITPGDRIRIEIAGSGFAPVEVEVPPDGRVPFPKLGVLACAGRTPLEIESSVSELLERAGFVGRSVPAVTVVELAPRQVFLLKGVRNPGAYSLPPGASLRLTQVISLGGGVAEEANATEVRILRPRTGGGLPTVTRFDLNEITDGGKIENDVRILPGDTIFLPDRRNPDGWVHVGGAVRRPDRYPWIESEAPTVLRVLMEAGGLLPSARPGSVTLLRRVAGGQEAIRVDLRDALEGNVGADLPLEPGDLVIVPGDSF